MTRYLIYSFITILSLGSHLSAQTLEESLRLSERNGTGTARGMGVAGAFGAVGADFSSVSINPAGLGLFRSSEFTVSPALDIHMNEARYLNQQKTDRKSKFHIDNFGVLFSKEIQNSKWKFRNIGFSYITYNKFYDSYSLSAENPNNSFLDYYANQAAGSSPSDWNVLDPLGIGLFYEGYLLNVGANNIYSSVAGPGLTQTESYDTDKSHRAFNISASGNYNDRVYLGASLNFPDYQYDVVHSIGEEDKKDIYNTFESYNYLFEERTEGDGININLGIICRVISPLRLGLSFNSGTSYSIETFYSSALESNLEGIQQTNSDTYSSPEGFFGYNFNLPYTITGSAAYIFKKGFLSMDYSFIDHSDAFYSARTDGDFGDQDILDAINSSIKESYQANSTVKLGGELARDQLRYRLGLILKTSPYINIDPELEMMYTAGFGYRLKSMTLDLGYRYGQRDKTYSFYSGTEDAKVLLNSHEIIFSLGFRF